MSGIEKGGAFVVLISAGALSFYVTLAGTALMSLSRDRVHEWLEEGKAYARVLDHLLETRKRLLSFLDFSQLFLAFVYFCALSWLVFQLLSPAGPGAPRAALQGIAILLAGFAAYAFLFQFFPRRLGHDHAEKISKTVGGPVAALFKLFGWIAPLFERSSVLLANLFGRVPAAKQPSLSDEEIRMMVRLGNEEPIEIEKEEKKMIESVVTFGQTLVKEIMTPRIDMICVDSGKTIPEVLDVAMHHGHSKFPVYEGTIDNILGIAYVKDLFRLFRNGQQGTPLKEVVRKPFFVPESKKVDDLLRDMQREKISMVIVVDEYGGTDGLVTIEDLVEEIVGEIADEHDKVTPAVLHLGENTWLVDGKINIEDLNAQLDLTLPSEEFDTLGGYVYGLMGKVPKAGDKVETDSVILEVTEIHRQRISKVKVTAKAPVEAQKAKEE